MAVLIKGQSISCSQRSRDHYLRGDENEKITVLDVCGFATKDADEALSMIELSAKGTKCKRPLYSAKLNPELGRDWSRQEVDKAIVLLENNLGLTGHARVVVEHLKHNRTHYHVLWNRFPPEGGPATNMGNNYAIHLNTQREIEKEFGLKPMMAKGRDFKDWEVKWAKRYGYDIFKLREQITADFNNVKSGQEFMAALKARGVVLCRGDKSQFVVILPWGQHKALSSMIYGRPRKTMLRSALADIDISRLPTVAEGKAQVKATLPKTKRGGGSTIRVRPKGKRGSGSFVKGRYVRGHIDSGAAPTVSGGFSTPAPLLYRPGTSSPGQPHMPTAALGKSTVVDTSAAGSRQPEPAPHRPVSRGGMGAEQLADYTAACDGKITWQQYFMRWDNGGLSL